MNRGMLGLVGLLSCAALVACGDSTSDAGGAGQGGDAAGGTDQGGDPSTGGGTEGATCAGYCDAIMDACVAGNAQYADLPACLRECAAFDQGDAGAMSGDNLECRTYHAGVAAAMDAPVHCVHAGPLGGGAIAMAGCGTIRCDAFCAIADEICAGEDMYPFTSIDDCTTDCQGYNDDVDFNIEEISGDTLACRMYHLSVAATDGQAAVHCGHVSGSECM